MIAPLGGGGLLAGIACVLARAGPNAASTPPSRRRRRRSRRRSRPGAPSYFDGWTAVVRRRRRRTIRARDHVAAPARSRRRIRSSCRWTTWPRAMKVAADRAHVIAEGAAACAVAAALSPAFAARGHRARCRRRLRRQHRPDPLRAARRRLLVTESLDSTIVTSPREPEPSPVPERLRRLPELANDLWWTWNHANPRSLPPARLPALAPDRAQPGADAAAHVAGDARARGRRRALPRALRRRGRCARRRAQRRADTWWRRRYPESRRHRSRTSRRSLRSTSRCRSTPAASACSPAITARRRATSAFRSSASASCIRRGTFTRPCPPEGWQQEIYERLNWTTPRSSPPSTPDGKPCIVAVPLGNRSVLVAVWLVRLGRVSLYLLDTDLEENAPWDRELSARLYGGDRETRIQQEIILGIGGVRALKAMGAAPAVWHLNEGHAAFVVLQRIRDQIEHGMSFDAALRGRSADDGVHDAYARARRARRVSVHTRRNASRRRVGLARRPPRCLPRARPLRQRQRPALQHDGAGAANGWAGSTASARSTAR